jgi:UDP-N-acetylglucosamine--N-acetylmuramyl-(pentapeptide) pyrophosphoryl-undecaprenol N-acetylglucosamine transferase
MLAVVTGGGTGGHAIPAKVIVEALMERNLDVFYVGSINGIERKIMQGNFNKLFLKVSGIKGKNIYDAFKGLVLILIAFVKMFFKFLKNKPDFILGVGGFVSAPSLLAGVILRIPIYLQEQNSIPGMVTKYFSNFSRKVFLGFEDTSRILPKEKVIVIGNPLRKDFLKAHFQYKAFDKSGKMNILVLGGSKGAKFINELVLNTLKMLDKEMFNFYHQTGGMDKEKATKIYEKYGFNSDVFDFTNDIVKYYEKAHFVIARAGAMTVTEILYFKIPALFIPYPYAIYDHQAKNAEFAVKIGAAMMYREKDINESKLAGILMELYEKPEKLQKMSERAESFTLRNPAQEIVNFILEDIGVQG